MWLTILHCYCLFSFGLIIGKADDNEMVNTLIDEANEILVDPWRALYKEDYFEGDILEAPKGKNAIPKDELRWPNGTVPFMIDLSLVTQIPLILRAMKHYRDKTCIKFVPRLFQKDYIKIFKGQGCYSYVGRIGQEQVLSLGDGCHYMGTIIHELGHAIGFYHEQNRSDRDEYIDVFWNNIIKGMESQFRKLEPEENRLYDKFDYESIMLYGEKAFSVNQTVKTMSPKASNVTLVNPYDRDALSAADVARINTLYEC